MLKLLYRATNAEGKRQAGYVEADSAEEAVARLKTTGFTDIDLHRATAGAALRSRLAGLSETESAQLAEFELHAIETPTDLWWLLRAVARRWWGWVVADLFVLLIGVILGNLRWVGLALGLLALLFGIPAWRFRHARHYDQLLRAYAVGDWARAEKLIAKLSGASESRNLEFDLAIRSAVIQARQGELAAALASLEPWRARLRDRFPALFPGRVAAVHAAVDDYAAFVAHMNEALALSNGDPQCGVEAALAEARFGSVERAQSLLEAVNQEALPVGGRAFIQWTRGMIALRQGAPTAQGVLAQAVAGFLARSAMPANWMALAACSGAYALALARDGKTDEARMILDRVAPVLTVHGDVPLRAGLRDALGEDALPPQPQVQ